MTKADVIRELLRANPEGMPKDLAKKASKLLRSEVKPSDVSNYKTIMKKNGELNGAASAPVASPAPASAPPAPKPTPVAVGRQTMTVTETVEMVKELVGQMGKDELKKLVDVV